jgi:hypothetical protein
VGTMLTCIAIEEYAWGLLHLLRISCSSGVPLRLLRSSRSLGVPLRLLRCLPLAFGDGLYKWIYASPCFWINRVSSRSHLQEKRIWCVNNYTVVIKRTPRTHRTPVQSSPVGSVLYHSPGAITPVYFHGSQSLRKLSHCFTAISGITAPGSGARCCWDGFNRW